MCVADKQNGSSNIPIEKEERNHVRYRRMRCGKRGGGMMVDGMGRRDKGMKDGGVTNGEG